MKNILKTAVIPIVAALVACVVLFLVALIPQSAIQKNASVAAGELVSQPQWPTVLNTGDPTYRMDNYTDSQIMMQSYNLNISNPRSVLTNPKHISDSDGNNMAYALDEVVNGGADNEISYVRYWMGFRIFVRPLMLFGSYFTIRKIAAFVFYFLMMMALIAVAKTVDVKTALCFGVSLILVNPAIISQSLQFSCTFMLVFLFVLYICIRCNRMNAVFAFCIFGVLTQFFDFYTTPIVTFGIPVLIYLVATRETQKPIWIALKTFFAWIYGYVMMWFMKLLLVTMFTDINGFQDGFHRFAERTGILAAPGSQDSYSAVGALKAVCHTVFQEVAVRYVFIVVSIMALTCIAVIWIKQKSAGFLHACPLLLVGILPLVWFMVAAEATSIHAWFQYRSVAVSFMVLFLLILQTVSAIKGGLGSHPPDCLDREQIPD